MGHGMGRRLPRRAGPHALRDPPHPNTNQLLAGGRRCGVTRVTPTAAAKLDATTPKWPVVEANLADPPTVTVGGVTTEVTGDDPQREIIAAAAAQARGNGRPIRARVAIPGGQVHRLIVTPTGRVTRLDHPTTGAPVSAGKPSRPRKADPSTRKTKRK